MRKALSFLLCLFLAAGLVSVANAQTVSCPEARLTFSVPDSWISDPLPGSDDPGLCLLLRGDGLTLSFDGAFASLSIEGGQSWTGSYELTGGKALTIHDDSKEGPTVNLAKGAAVTASSVETEDFPPEYAADGDLGTRWSSAYVDPSWLLLDLGEEKTVGAAVVYFETACSADFTFEVSSDGKKFEEAAEVTGNSAAGTESPVTVTFPEAKRARYVRFNGLSRATQWGHSIYELELYGIIPGEAVCALAFDGGRIDLTLRGNTYSLSKAN